MRAMLAGKWTYRSYRNDPALVGDDAVAALATIFGEGVFDFEETGPHAFTGGLGMGAGYALTLTGEWHGDGDRAQFAIVGLGIDGTATAGWRYDYNGGWGYRWPDGIDQVPSLLGTVVRVNPHGPNAPAGVTASFVAVRQPGEAAPRTVRRNMLTVGL
jgi:hypothetical protein